MRLLLPRGASLSCSATGDGSGSGESVRSAPTSRSRAREQTNDVDNKFGDLDDARARRRRHEQRRWQDHRRRRPHAHFASPPRPTLRVQPFKVGPDFLDGMQHNSAACGVSSINLDGWMLQRSGCLAAFYASCAASQADIAIVEGCMGLHDGTDGKTDAGSTAQIAKWLNAPVLLVLDAWNLARSAAAMVHGYKTFDPDVHVSGVLFNRVAGVARSEWIVQATRSRPTTRDGAVLGCLPKDKMLGVPERLLGLLPPAAPQFPRRAPRELLRVILWPRTRTG